MILPRKVLLITALMASAGALYSAESARTPARPTKPDIRAPGAGSDLQKLMEQFRARRDAILANREALMAQLKNATADQRKAILEKMQAQQKALVDEQRALGKQIRDEMRKLKPGTPGMRR